VALTLLEALDIVRAAGGRIERDPRGPVLRGCKVPPAVVEALKAQREGLEAVLALRQLHGAMGFDEADVLLIERALLSGQLAEVRLVMPSPAGVTA
jgi:hypothetical protein